MTSHNINIEPRSLLFGAQWSEFIFAREIHYSGETTCCSALQPHDPKMWHRHGSVCNTVSLHPYTLLAHTSFRKVRPHIQRMPCLGFGEIGLSWRSFACWRCGKLGVDDFELVTHHIKPMTVRLSSQSPRLWCCYRNHIACKSAKQSFRAYMRRLVLLIWWILWSGQRQRGCRSLIRFGVWIWCRFANCSRMWENSYN